MMDLNSSHLVSVITVTKNCADLLYRTILSVEEQEYAYVEYIVIDGASEDGTREIIAAHRHVIDQAISEPDRNLYDAMNKGLELASGRWVIFLNAGDTFHGADALGRAFIHLSESRSTIAIGRVENLYPGGFRLVAPIRCVDLKWGMRFSHQAAFIQTEYHKKNRFLMEDGLAADYAFFLRAERDGIGISQFDEVVANFDVSGLSSVSHLANIQREKLLYKKYMGHIPMAFWLRRLYAAMAVMIKIVAPDFMANVVRKIRR